MNSSNDEKIEEEIYNFLISLLNSPFSVKSPIYFEKKPYVLGQKANQKLYYPIVLPLISEEKQKHFHQTKDLLIKLLTIKVSLYYIKRKIKNSFSRFC